MTDVYRLQLMLKFLQIKRRGAPPLGGGEVQFLCPVVKQVKTLNFVEPGKIKRIRGIAYVLSTILAFMFTDQFGSAMLYVSARSSQIA